MKRTFSFPLVWIWCSCVAGVVPAAAQVHKPPRLSMSAPVGTQAGGQLGSSVATEGGFTVAGAPYDDTGKGNAGVVKVFESSTGALLHVLRAPTPTPNENFGYAVAISGTRVVVGGSDTWLSEAGRVYVYDLASATPTVPLVILTNDRPLPTRVGFGSSVAISGTRVAVGVPEGISFESGFVQVYDLSNGTTTVMRNLITRDFGQSVAISGDRAVVTARAAAYVYDLSPATPTVVAEFNYLGSSTDSSGRRRIPVAISGSRVVVGSDRDLSGTGSASVYDLDSATPLIPVATLIHPGPPGDGAFGWSVALSGSQVLVGTSPGGALARSAYVYDLVGASPSVPVATLTSPNSSTDDQFASSLAISGSRVVVGASQDDMGAVDAGSAFVYDLNSGNPGTPLATLNNPGPEANDLFGVSVAISGSRMIVGDSFDDTAAEDAGSAYVYDLASADPTVPLFTLTNPGPSIRGGERFGGSVAISGTVLVVGAVYGNASGGKAGNAYVYDLGSATPTLPIASLQRPNPFTLAGFGGSVVISGTTVVVGASFGSSGKTYVYNLSSGTPEMPVATLASDRPALDSFGATLAISGSRLAVGAPGIADNAGRVYVYDLDSATPTIPVTTLNHPSPRRSAFFGLRTANSGTRVAVGSQDGWYLYDLSTQTPTIPTGTLGFLGRPAVGISGANMVIGAFLNNTDPDFSMTARLYDLSSTTPTTSTATLKIPGLPATASAGSSVATDGSTAAIGIYDASEEYPGNVYVYGLDPPPTDADDDGLLDAWELTYWPTNSGHGPMDDFDRDGSVELLELAFGLNPTVPDAAALPAVVDEGGYLTITITKHPGVAYEVQSAETLLAGNDYSFNAATTTVISNTTTTLKVRDNFPIGVRPSRYPSRYMRVRVNASP